MACGWLTCHAGQHWIGSGPRVESWQGSLPADRVRLGVRDEGVYRVAAAEIAAASGRPEADVLAALGSGEIALTCQGRTVAWTTAGGALYFFGVPTREFFAPENVYWLGFGAGTAMASADATPAGGGDTNQWFVSSASYRTSFVAPYDPRDRRSTNGSLTNILNFGKWIKGSTTVESERLQTRAVAMPGYAAGAATGLTVRVSLASYRDFVTPDSHTCEILVNGVSGGTQSWSGEQGVSFDYVFPAGTAASNTVQLTVRNAGGTTSAADFLLLDAVVFYPRSYLAETGMVLCTGGPAATAAAGGFRSAGIGVWDVTQEEAPVALGAPVWQGTDGLWQTAFACGDASRRYAVFEAEGGCFEPSVSGVRDTDWSASGEMPELAIVVPPHRWVSGFVAAVQPLADFRTAQGLRTRVVDAEELYNAFSDGLVHPKAFRMFSAAGVTNGPAQTLRYLLFAGYGGTDYKLDAFKFGVDERIPTLFPLYLFSEVEDTYQAALLLPNDPVLGDVAGGAAPEVAVGRFIATNAVELTYMVNKTIRYELTEAWKSKAVFSACSQFPANGDPDFTAIAQSTASGFASGGWTLAPFYPAQNDDDIRELWMDAVSGTGVKAEFTAGAGFFYYVGHSNDQTAGTTANKDKALVSDVRLTAGTWGFAPVGMLMGCRMGRWTLFNLKTGDLCLTEAGVRNRTSGFTAAISPAGYLMPYDAANFSYAFSGQVAAGARRLGDAWRGAFAALGDAAAERMQHMTLLGDPSLCIRAGETARGTPAEWLIARGLTGDPYADLSDQDSDGFLTWQEYQAGTSPLQGGVRIRAISAPGGGGGALPLAFEAVAGLNFRVMSTTNLLSGAWEPLPWRAGEGAPWSSSGIPGDWPVKALEVPYDAGETRRFYKIESF